MDRSVGCYDKKNKQGVCVAGGGHLQGAWVIVTTKRTEGCKAFPGPRALTDPVTCPCPVFILARAFALLTLRCLDASK